MLASSGPVAILAGAGTGKTRVISRRTAYAIATEASCRRTRCSSSRSRTRRRARWSSGCAALGLPGVTARTFHAHALCELRHFWPSRHDGQPIPELLDSKLPIIGRLARQLPGHYRFTPAKDLADEIEWAKSRRITPRALRGRRGRRRARAADPGRPVRPRPTTATSGRRHAPGRIDFDDLLVEHGRPARGRRGGRRDGPRPQALVQRRRVPGHEPAPAAAARAVARRVAATCASSATRTRRSTRSPARRPTFLTAFAERWPGAREVDARPRTTARRRRSSRSPTGCSPPRAARSGSRRPAATARSRTISASRVGGGGARRRWSPGSGSGWARGSRPSEVAVLVRTNAQLAPIEEALTRAGIAYLVRGLRFYDRPEVRGALIRASVASRRSTSTASGSWPPIRERWTEALGYEPEARRRGRRGPGAAGERSTRCSRSWRGSTRGDPHDRARRRPRGPRGAGRPRDGRARRTASTC